MAVKYERDDLPHYLLPSWQDSLRSMCQVESWGTVISRFFPPASQSWTCKINGNTQTFVVSSHWACPEKGGFPGGSRVKNPPANAGDTGSISGSGISPGEGNGYPLQYCCLETSHGQRSLVGHSPWGPKRVGHDLMIKQQKHLEKRWILPEATLL